MFPENLELWEQFRNIRVSEMHESEIQGLYCTLVIEPMNMVHVLIKSFQNFNLDIILHPIYFYLFLFKFSLHARSRFSNMICNNFCNIAK